MEFRMLGPLEVWDRDARLAVSGRQAPKALVMLLGEPGRVVPVDRLVDAIWDGEPPRTAAQQVQKTISGLRRALGDQGGRLRTVPGGYRLDAEPHEVDLLRAEAAERRSREARAGGDLDRAREAVSEALAEWRGPSLAGVSGELAGSIADRLDEYRLSLIEQRIDLDLELGGHPEVLEELRRLSADHPFRQVFASQLMLALYRCGLAPEALRVFAEVAERLADELGADPGRPLRDLHAAILREDASLDLEPSAPRRLEAPRTADRAARTVAASEPDGEGPEHDSLGRSWHWSARLAALGLTVLMMAVGTARDGPGPDRFEAEEDAAAVQASLSGELPDPLWTYPSLESGSAVMMVEDGLLVLDRSELRLESEGEVVWSEHFDAGSAPAVAVSGDSIVLSRLQSIEQPSDIGTVSVIDLRNGIERSTAWGLWPIAVNEEVIIGVSCEPLEGGEVGDCLMMSRPPGGMHHRWTVAIEDRSFPFESAAPYGSPWGQSLLRDYLLLESFPNLDGRTGERLSVHDAETGDLVAQFDNAGVESAEIVDDIMTAHSGSAFVADGRCEARIWAYDLRAAEVLWERYVDTGADDLDRCQPLPTLGADDGLLPVTLGQSASVVWQRSGELQWTVGEPSVARLLVDDALVTTDPESGDISVWDVWARDKRWTASGGDLMWARGSTLWVLDRTSAGIGCGGVVGYSLESGESICLPGTLEYLTEDVVVTADGGTWQAWPADLWQ